MVTEDTSMEVDYEHSSDEVLTHPSLQNTLTQITRLLPANKWHAISPGFYTTFWQLSLYDICVPRGRYQAEINKLKSLIASLENDRSDPSLAGIAKRKREKERANTMIAEMQVELLAQEKNHEKVMKRLEAQKQSWFRDST